MGGWARRWRSAPRPAPGRWPYGVLILFDLGSARLVAEMALEQLSAERRARILLSDAPIVEGAVVAAVEASIGSALPAVAATAHEAIGMQKIS